MEMLDIAKGYLTLTQGSERLKGAYAYKTLLKCESYIIYDIS